MTALAPTVPGGDASTEERRPTWAARLGGAAATLWRVLDEPARGRRVPGTLPVAIIALLVGFASCLWFMNGQYNMAYADAVSHLTISRRIFDSMAPGFQQLGTVWLPVPHLVLLPFVASLDLWASGWAAGLLGMLCLSATAAGIYRLLARVNIGRAGRIAAMLALLANPNVLYTYTTALTEPVLIASLCAAFAGLAHWATSERRLSAGELAVFGGVPAAAALLSRYEGWALVLGGSVFVAIAGYRRYGALKPTMKMVLAFAAVPLAGVIWWLSYNWAIYQNPLEFMIGQYSASALQQDIVDQGLVPTKGNLGLALATYNVSVFQTAGPLLVLLAVVGVIVIAWQRGFQTRGLLLYITLIPYLFSIASLYLGQSVVHNAWTLPNGWWNNRYALCSLIAVSVFAAVAVHFLGWVIRNQRIVLAGVGLVVVAQLAWWLPALDERSGILGEADNQYEAIQSAWDAARWLGAEYEGGGILIDESAGGNAILPLAGIPLAEYWNRSTGDFFETALDDPQAHVEWIVVNTSAAVSADEGPVDLVAQALTEEPHKLNQYRLAYSTATHSIYERVGG